MKPRSVAGWICSLAIILCPLQAWAQQRPFKTDDAELLGLGRVRADIGVEYLQGQHYPLSGLEGDLTRLGIFGIHVGVGDYAEFQLSGVLQDFLSITRRTPPVIAPDFLGIATSDFGNLMLATKLRLLAESKNQPALAFKFAVELPNASNESGLGKDETEFYGTLLFSKRIGRIQVTGNLGLAILGSPVQANTQTDKLIFGCGLLVPLHRKVNLVGEVYGYQGPERTGNENRAQARFGLQWLSGSLRWDVAGVAGLERYDPDSGLVIGVTYEFQAFAKARKPKKIR